MGFFLTFYRKNHAGKKCSPSMVFYGSGFVPWYVLSLYALCQFQFRVFLILSWLVPAYRKRASQLLFKYSPKRKKRRKISTFSSIILASLTSILRTQRALKAWYWCYCDNHINETRNLKVKIRRFIDFVLLYFKL